MMRVSSIFSKWPLFTCVGLLLSTAVYSINFSAPENKQRFVGAWHYITVKPGDSLGRIAFEHDVSLINLLKYNPHVAIDTPIHPQQSLLIPNCYWVPELKPDEILINLANQTLYYQPSGSESISVYPVTIGKPEHPTPQGDFYIKRKKKDPIWYPTASIRQAYAAKGKSYPSAVAPGRYNPLGTYVMYLNKPTYLIHTAVNGRALGGAQSFGCVRMYERDIGQLYPQIKVNTPVRIIDEPISNAENLIKYCTRSIQLLK
jgi:lipoprotein-anchoring transpeptidase ErfK/SrfK